MRGQKGITLIALVITIIVMLILVTVTISIATNGNLFTHAGNAAKQTNAHVENEERLQSGNLMVDGNEVDIQSFVNSKVTE